MPIKETMTIPEAKAGQRIGQAGEHAGLGLQGRIKPMAEQVQPAKNDGGLVRFASLMDLCRP